MADGAVPDGWSLASLGEHLDRVLGGGTPSRRRPEYWSGDIPWASVKDMTGPRLDGTQETITDTGLANSATNLIAAGTIVLATRMAVGAVARTVRPTAINQDLKALFPKPTLSADYLFYLLQMHSSRLALLSPGTTVSGLRLEALRALPILLPPLPEQRKIAEILSSVDDAIEKAEAVIEQVRRVKQGLAQQLLTRGLPGRHTRFKQTEVGEIPACWEVVSLGTAIQEMSSGFASGARDEAGIAQLRMNNLTTDGRVILDEVLKVPVPADVDRWTLRSGDFLFNNTNSIDLVGKCAVFRALWSRGFLRSLAIRHVGQAAIYGGELRRVKVPLPPLSEQQAMLQVVQALDKRADAERQTVEGLGAAKSALMHALLTGQVRVKVGGSALAETGP